MLPYILAIAVGVSSLILFSTAFLMSDVHQKDDFFWSAIGLFYALVLWFCATRITGGLLLGQSAAAALLVSNNWQIIKLRKVVANPSQQEKSSQFSVVETVKNIFNRRPKSQTPPSVTETKVENTQVETPANDKSAKIPDEVNTELDQATVIDLDRLKAEKTADQTSVLEQVNTQPQESPATATTESETPPEKEVATPEPEIASPQPTVSTNETTPESSTETTEDNTPQATATDNKPGLFGKMFSFGKQKPSSITNTKLDDILDDEELLDEDFEDSSAETAPAPVKSPETIVEEESPGEITEATQTASEIKTESVPEDNTIASENATNPETVVENEVKSVPDLPKSTDKLDNFESEIDNMVLSISDNPQTDSLETDSSPKNLENLESEIDNIIALTENPDQSSSVEVVDSPPNKTEMNNSEPETITDDLQPIDVEIMDEDISSSTDDNPNKPSEIDTFLQGLEQQKPKPPEEKE